MIQVLAIVVGIGRHCGLHAGYQYFPVRKEISGNEVGRNKDMIRLGLSCPKCEERKDNRKIILRSAINPGKLQPDWSSLVK